MSETYLVTKQPYRPRPPQVVREVVMVEKEKEPGCSLGGTLAGLALLGLLGAFFSGAGDKNTKK